MKMRMSRGNLIFIKIKTFYRFLFKINILYTGLKIRKKESVNVKPQLNWTVKKYIIDEGMTP